MKYAERVCVLVVALILVFVMTFLIIGAFRVRSALTHAWWGKDYKETTKDMIAISDALPVPLRASGAYNRDEAMLHADMISRIEQAESEGTEVSMHPELSDYGLIGNMGVHAVKGRVSRIAFRGTSNAKEMRENMNYSQVPFLKGKVHRGFLKTYNTRLKADVLKAAHQALEDGHTLVISGHSLGAALANMAALDVKDKFPELSVVVYAFAPPRQGNPEYAQMLTDSVTAHQLINFNDLVSVLPMTVTPNLLNPAKPFLYEHGGVLHVFNQLEPRRFLVDMHLLTAYQPTL